MSPMKVAGLLLLAAAVANALPPQSRNTKQDDGCTSIGGTCKDWRYNPCTAGYSTGLCSGDNNNRCCLNCDQTCQNDEAQWSASDSACTAAGGDCLINSNYCAGIYTSGKCGGPANRQCCQQPAQGDCPQIITRSQWGARAPSSISYVGDNLAYHFVHHAETPDCDSEATCSARVRSIQAYHMDSNGWSDIGYNFLIGGDGNIYEGRGWGVLGAHTGGYNSVGYGTCFIGSFTDHIPVPEAVNKYMALLECSTGSGYVASNYQMKGHRQAPGGTTSCPGDMLYNLIQSWPGWTNGNLG